MKSDSEWSFSGVSAPSQITAHAKDTKPVLYDAHGRPLVRVIGFTAASPERKESAR